MKKLMYSLGLAAILAWAGAAQAEVVWKMSTKQPADSPEGKAYQVFADKVAEFTNGEMTIRVYPSEQLGKQDAVLEQLQQGTIHLFVDGPQLLEKYVPEI